jgi:hypothetical protein
MRIRPTSHRLWKWWWPLGGVIVVGMIVAGVADGWSASLWAAAGVVAVVYLGVPVTAATLDELADARKQPRIDNAAESGPDSPAPLATERPTVDMGQMAQMAREPPKRGDIGSSRDSESNTRPGYTRPGSHQSLSANSSPSSELLQERIAAISGRPFQPLELTQDRPWRKVGSKQFAALVQALGIALPSVNTADDTADLAGVRGHLIRKGRDTPKERWQAVLERAIDDEVDDVLCAEALKYTNSPLLRAAVSDWIGAPNE